MENKKSGHITEKELDSLLNEAFLNLDFETNIKNKEVLGIVANHTMTKSSFSIFLGYRFNLFFFLLSFLFCLASFYNYMNAVPTDESGILSISAAPIVKPVEKQSAVKEIEKKQSLKKTTEDLIKVQPFFIQSKTSHSKKHPSKNIANTAIQDTSVKETTKDTAANVRAVISEKEHKDSASFKNNISPTDKNQQERSSVILLKSKQNKSSKKVDAIKPDSKVKVAKRRKGRRFFKDGTFRMKNRKYGKSR